jgi:hypothetical protein
MNDSTTAQQVTAYLPYAETVFWMVMGIIFSIVLPLAVKVLQNKGVEPGMPTTLSWRVWRAWMEMGGNRYVMVVVAAIVVASIVTFLLDLKFPTAREAALGGFGWESLVNKLFGKPALTASTNVAHA